MENPDSQKPNSILESENLILKENSFIPKKLSHQKLVFKSPQKEAFNVIWKGKWGIIIMD